MERIQIKVRKPVRKKPKFKARKPKKVYTHEEVDPNSFPNPASVKRLRTRLLNKSNQSERRLYRVLKSLGIEFIKQYPILCGCNLYFTDAYVPSLNLVIEMDGGYHLIPQQIKKDRKRERLIKANGYYLMRFTDDVMFEQLTNDIVAFKEAFVE